MSKGECEHHWFPLDLYMMKCWRCGRVEPWQEVLQTTLPRNILLEHLSPASVGIEGAARLRRWRKTLGDLVVILAANDLESGTLNRARDEIDEISELLGEGNEPLKGEFAPAVPPEK